MIDSEEFYELVAGVSKQLEPIATDMEPRLDLPHNIRAVLFDIYGTLLISGSGDVGTVSETQTSEALATAMNEAGVKTTRDLLDNGLELFKSLIEKSHSISRKKGIDYPEVDIVKVWANFIERARARKWCKAGYKTDYHRLAVHYECLCNPVWPMPSGWVSAEKLRQKGIPLGIVSNAQFYTPIIFEVLYGESIPSLGFKENLSTWSYKLGEAKPSLKMFKAPLAALAKRGITPEQTLYVGNDMLNDVWTASQCGIKTALFAGDQRSLRLRDDDERCKGLVPDMVLTDLAQLSPLFEDAAAS